MGKQDVWVMAGLLALALVLYMALLKQEDLIIGEVRLNGQVVLRLDATRDGVYPLPGHPAVHFGVKDNTIAFIQSDCPDYICVNTGYLRRSGQMAVCLPNRVSLAVIGGRRELDAVAY
jgi:hypothetical protein